LEDDRHARNKETPLEPRDAFPAQAGIRPAGLARWPARRLRGHPPRRGGERTADVGLRRAARRPRAARRFTYGKHDHSPRWSPDGRWLAFVSERGEKNQVFLAPLDGGESAS